MSDRRVLSLSIGISLLVLCLGCGQSPDNDVSSNDRTTQPSNDTSTTDDSSNDTDTSSEELPEAETDDSSADANEADSDKANNEEPESDDTTTTKPSDDGDKDTSDDNTTTPPVKTPPANAEPWGDLRGQFLFGGTPAEAKKITPTKDVEYCGKQDIPDELVVVNPENKGIANVVVYLYVKRGADPPAVHSSYEATATEKVAFNNDKCRFQPHVCLLRPTQTLVIGNKDTVGHNTKMDTASNPAINPITPAGGTIEHQFTSEERSPAMVSCSIHPWMTGWLLVRESPYFAVSDENGNFEIKNLPAGEWTFTVWHEVARYLSDIKQDGNPAKWIRGRVEVTITPGLPTDLGKIEIPAESFAD